jgi:ribosome-binding factor A
MSHRIERVNALLRREISDLIQHQAKDPRLDTFVTVTQVETSPDLKFAKVFVSSIQGKQESEKMLEALAAASGFLRRELSRTIRMRYIPDLTFIWDDSIEHGDHILRLIDQVSEEREHPAG